jgi:hypothetical protein
LPDERSLDGGTPVVSRKLLQLILATRPGTRTTETPYHRVGLGAVGVQLEAADFERIDALVPPSGYAVRYYDGAGYADFRPHSSRSVV